MRVERERESLVMRYFDCVAGRHFAVVGESWLRCFWDLYAKWDRKDYSSAQVVSDAHKIARWYV